MNRVGAAAHPHRARGSGRLGLWFYRLGVGGLIALLLTGGGAARAAAEPPLVLVQNASGRFEVSAADPGVAHRVSAAVEEAWGMLRGPLQLPEAFASPLFIRATAAGGGHLNDAAPFRVTVEIGGLVSLRLRSDLAGDRLVRQAVVQGLLMRLAVARHGVDARLTVPWWLEQACVSWWETHADAAQLDALKQATAGQPPPTVEALLMGGRSAPEPRAEAAAHWLLAFLQAESGPAREWPTFLGRLLMGDDPLIALVESYPGRFGTTEERELWWRTGYHHLRRIPTLPALDAADSRAQLGALARFVFAGGNDDADVVVPLGVVMARSREGLVAAELARRARQLAKLAPILHPYYRNAGLSLGEVFGAHGADARAVDPRCRAFEEDWRNALQIEAATNAALYRLEQGGRAR